MTRTPGGLIVEVTDGTETRYRGSLFYDLAKASVIRLALAQAAELKPRGVTVIALTPGFLRSEAMLDEFGVTEENWRDAVEQVPHFCISESPTYVARGLAALAADPGNARYAGQCLSSGQLARIYGITDIDGSRPDCWSYVTEIEDTGLTARENAYR